MEVYEPVADAGAFVPRLAALARTHGVGTLAVGGERHTECFAPPPAAPTGASRRDPAPRER